MYPPMPEYMHSKKCSSFLEVEYCLLMMDQFRINMPEIENECTFSRKTKKLLLFYIRHVFTKDNTTVLTKNNLTPRTCLIDSNTNTRCLHNVSNRDKLLNTQQSFI